MDVETGSFARFTVRDEPGVLNVVTDALQQREISVLSLYQGRLTLKASLPLKSPRAPMRQPHVPERNSRH